MNPAESNARNEARISRLSGQDGDGFAAPWAEVGV